MKAAFTLIELLVVVAIIGILVSLAFPVISSVRNSAKIAAARSDMKTVENAVDSYYAEYRKLPVPDPFQGGDASYPRRWSANTGGLGTLAIVYNIGNRNERRLTFGWQPGRSRDQKKVDTELYRVFIAALQGSNKFGLNPRESTFLQLQEGRPEGLYMDPWSKGFTFDASGDNRFYQVWLDHDFNNLITVAYNRGKTAPSGWDGIVEGRKSVLRCLGPDRVCAFPGQMERGEADDFFSFSSDIYKLLTDD